MLDGCEVVFCEIVQLLYGSISLQWRMVTNMSKKREIRFLLCVWREDDEMVSEESDVVTFNCPKAEQAPTLTAWSLCSSAST